MSDFQESLKKIRKSVAVQSLAFYTQWNSEYGDVTIWQTIIFTIFKLREEFITAICTMYLKTCIIFYFFSEMEKP